MVKGFYMSKEHSLLSLYLNYSTIELKMEASNLLNYRC
jgi:hypothetical protein